MLDHDKNLDKTGLFWSIIMTWEEASAKHLQAKDARIAIRHCQTHQNL
jgi:hypothetical protein